MLDTNAYSNWQRGLLWQEIISTASDIYLPLIVIGELEEGFLGGSRTQENQKILQTFLSFPVVKTLTITRESCKCFAQLSLYLRRKGIRIPQNDLWLVKLSLEHYVLLTTGDAHFSHLPQISVLLPDT